MGAPTDYNDYRISWQERWVVIIIGMIVITVAASIFFRHGIFWIIPLPLSLFFPKMYAIYRKDRRQRALTIQFQEMLGVLTASLAAGQSVESAFVRAWSDLSMLYKDENTPILIEINRIRNRLELGDNIEQALQNFSQRAGIAEIDDFSEVFRLAKRSGGNLVEVMRHTAQIIQEKLFIQRDIEVLIAKKKLEARLMVIAPFLMIALLRISSPEYMSPLYEGVGILIMGIALITLLATMKIIMSIASIRV